MPALEDLHVRFGDDVAFVVVYIKEAHPEDGWVVTHNREEGIRVMDPTSREERAEVVGACAARLPVRIPVVVDDLDNRVASAYGGWPDRLYLIGRDGRVAYRGGMGPFGFLPDELRTAIEAELAPA